jgi:hypothetical protein
MKLYKWFYWTSNPQFRKKSQSVPGARSSLVPPCKISLGGPEWWYALLAYVVVNLTTIRSWPQWPLLLCRRYPSLTNAQLGVYVDFIYLIELEYNAQLGVYVDFIPLNLNIMAGWERNFYHKKLFHISNSELSIYLEGNSITWAC